MSKRGSAFWDMLPIVLIVSVVCGSLFFVDFTGHVILRDDLDGDGVIGDYDGCPEVSAPDGLVSYWAFEEDSSETVAYDSYASVNNLEAYFVTGKYPLVQQPGQVGYSYRFYSSQYDNLWVLGEDSEATESLRFTDEFTIMFWLKENSISGLETVIAKIDFYEGYGVFLESDGTVKFSTWSSGGTLNELIGSEDVVDNVWHHVAVVKTSTEKLVYVDGSKDISEKISDSLAAGTTQMYIGRHPSYESSYTYNGYLDEIAIFSEGLSGGEIATLYNFGVAGSGYCSTSSCADADSDGYEDESCGGTDCDDTNFLIHPGYTENCYDLIDNDCDGLIDDADSDCGGTCADADLDGYPDASCGGTDCDDTNSSIYIGATEVCDDGLDNDCDTYIDCVDSDCAASLNANGYTCCQDNSSCTDNYMCDNSTYSGSNTCLECLESQWDYCLDTQYCVSGLCSDEAEEVATCLTDNIFWYGLDGAVVSELGNDEFVYPLIYSNISCDSISVDFDIYVEDSNTSLLTLSSLNGSVFDSDGDGINDSFYYYAEWNLSEYSISDNDYVFVASYVNESVESSTLKVCADLATCLQEDGSGGDDGEVDCASEWDCSAVDWSECDAATSTRTRDLSLCVQPTSSDCLTDYTTWPDAEASCIASFETDTEDEERTTDVPIFGWLNLLIVVFVLIGYYVYNGKLFK
jgi:hypothetical protein